MDHKTIKVLLVEDNPDFIRLVQKILAEAEAAHFELVHVDRLSKAKQPLAEGSSDVVLLDLGLPDSHGLDTFLKVHAQAPEVPIVVLTATDSDALEAMQQGAQDYLVKGNEESNLLVRAIRYAIKRKRSEEDLRKALDWQKAIFEGSRDAIFISDSDSRLIDVNHAACELTGYSKEELLTMRIPELREEMDPEAYHKYHNRIMEGEEIISEAKILRKDGSKVDAEFNNRRIIISNMQYIHTVARDITERKRTVEQIKASLIEKDVLLKEIHHRVKNNLQVISSLLSLQSRNTGNKQAQKMLRECHDRVQSMALIHEKLYQSGDLASIDFANYVIGLSSNLYNSYGISKKEISLVIDVKDISLSIDKLILCGFIINELVSNSLKYAFSGRKKREIRIGLRLEKENEFMLVVSDDGIGLPKDLDLQCIESFGLKLVSMFVRQLKGAFEVDRKGGTEFKITFTDQ